MDINATIQSALQHYQSGNVQESEQLCRKILNEHPDSAEVLYFLGIMNFESGNYDLAIEHIERSLRFDEANADAYHMLGMALQAEGRIESAIHYYYKTIQLSPDYVEAYNNLGNAFKEKGLPDQAINYYQNAIRINPNLSVTYRNLGVVYQEKGNLEEAIGYYKKAVRLDPDYAGTYHLLGYAFVQQTKLQEGIENYRLSLSLNPNSAKVLSNLGSALGYQGKLDEAEACLKRAIQKDPNYLSAYETLIMMMNYNARYDTASIYSEHLKFAEKFAEPLSSVIAPHANERSLDRKLKIGYVSPDFRQHPVAYFIEPVLQTHDRELFQILCYSNSHTEDEVTKCLQKHADEWHNVVGMSDDEVSQLIRRDEIDILIDLAGHSSNNRLLVFARKPAPIQASWIGYLATTGLSAMDYKIVDNYTDPPGKTERFHTEKLIRLPENFLCYLPDKNSPDVGPLPALSEGHITFGSFNNFAKVTAEVFTLWARILHELPTSRLIMKGKSFHDKTTCQYAIDMFVGNGIASERITLQSSDPSPKHLESYNLVDIGLDTFPFNGAATTCEAMWMGVPVVILEGTAYHSRSGVSLLSNVGVPELIAETHDEYVDIAVNLAADIERLKTLRGSLRSMMASSPLTDAKRFIVNLENSYRSMWENWCKSSPNL